MAWWQRASRTRYARHGPASLERSDAVVASTMRFDLSQEPDRKKLAKLQQQWQENGWYYVDNVGELKYAERFIRNSFRRVRLYAGFVRDPEAEPIPVLDAVRPASSDEEDADLPAGVETTDLDATEFIDEQLAMDCQRIVDGWAARDGGQSALMERAGGNIFVVGECLTVRRAVLTRRPGKIEDPETGIRRDERRDEVPQVMDWEVRSLDEVIDDPSTKQTRLRDRPDKPLEACEPIVGMEGEEAFVERIWRQHGRWSDWADSTVRAAQGVLDELDLLAKLARVSIRARILAGILTMPDEMDFPADEKRPGDASPVKRRVDFDRPYTEALAAAIGNEADANSVAPLLLRGPKDLLGQDAVRLIEIPRRYGEDERAQYEEAVTRLARTLDLPVEVVKGMADLNHWTAWQVEDSTYEAHIEPHVSVLAEGLTYALLRPALRDLGHQDEAIARCVVAADPSQLIRRPDRGKTATEGYGLMALSWDAWRRANGFGDDDAPSKDELVMRLAVQRSILTAELSAILLENSELLPKGTLAALKAEAAAPGTGPGDDDADAGDDGEGDTSDGSGTPPEDEAAVAAATPLAELLDLEPRYVAGVVAAARRLSTGTALATADRVLRERLQAAADAATTRALERAGARLRNKANRDATARAALTAAGDVPAADVGRVLGSAIVAALQVDEDELFSDAYLELHERYDEWTAATQAAALDAVAAVAGDAFTDDRRRDLEREQDDQREDGWIVFLAALLTFARARFAGNATDEDVGEFDATAVVPASVVREALAVAGGDRVEHELSGALRSALANMPVGGVSTGPTIRVTFEQLGMPWSGYTWLYGLSPRKTPFEPHAALNGVNFATWEDDVLAYGGDWPRVGHLYPGDHRYCRCDFAPAISEATAASAYPGGTQEV